MDSSLQTVKTAISQIEAFIQRVEKKDPSLTTRESEQSPYSLIFRLNDNTITFLAHPEALDLLIGIAPKVETYRGKGTQAFNDGIPRILQSILTEFQYCSSLREPSEPYYSAENMEVSLRKIANFALPRAQGDGKKILSHRAAELRKGYWDILADIAEEQEIPEALQLAKATAQDKKKSLPERSGAINYLFAHLSISQSQKKQPSDPEIEAIIGDLRDNPPSRDILFQILDEGVNSGQIDQMSALFDLEDFNEKNDD